MCVLAAGVNILPGGIHIQGPPGNRTGVCLVELASAHDVDEALKRDQQFMGRRFVDGESARALNAANAAAALWHSTCTCICMCLL